MARGLESGLRPLLMKKGLGVDGGIERLCLRLGLGGIPRRAANQAPALSKYAKSVSKSAKSSLAGKKLLQVSKILLIFVVSFTTN